MKPKLLSTKAAQYEAGTFEGNTSGAKPVGEQVLVRPDVAAEKTSGGVMIPDSVRERQSGAAETGVLVAVGDGAFVWNADRTRAWTGEKPKPGDRVYFARYSGTEIVGDDGKMFRLMSDNCIGAVRAG